MTGQNLHAASHEWATRPLDETYASLEDMHADAVRCRAESREATVAFDRLSLGVRDDDLVLRRTGDDGKLGGAARFNHWSFSQLCLTVGAPANFLRTLPPTLAADVLNHGLASFGNKPAQLCVRESVDRRTLRCLTSDYTRVWDAEILKHAIEAQSHGWMTPPARPSPMRDDPRARPATRADLVPNQADFGLSVREGDMIAPAGCYRSDRYSFLFQILPKRTIDTGTGAMMRGYFLRNSECRNGAWEITTYSLEAVCGNHISWGCTDVLNFRYVHSGQKIHAKVREMLRLLATYADAPASDEEQIIGRARARVLGANKTEVIECLLGRTIAKSTKHGLSQTTLEAGYDAAERFESQAGSPPTSLWGMVHGLTRESQRTGFADSRRDIDVGAGRLMSLVSGN